jgi:hypothetical protein
MAFFIAFACCVTDSNSAFDSIIRGYAPNTNSIGTNLSGLVVLLIALNIIYSAIFLLISGISTVII